MKRRNFKLWISFFTLQALTLPVAAQNGSTLLSRVDSTLNAFKDMTMLEKMTLIDKDGSQKVRDTKIYQKGTEMRLVRFLTPADVRGVGFLRLAEDRMYLYLPAFRKVRRIASSVKNEDFMGTDFTYEDLSQTEYAEDYRTSSIDEKEGQYVLELTPRPDADVSYAKLVLFADQSNYVIRKIEYFNERDKMEKVLTVDNVEEIAGYWIGRRMEMQSLKDDHRTVLELKDIKFDQGLSDNFFSERNLKRPER
ncbi:outer membrane lipoprotein-sorting protein [candidate division KSB1 bacterium]|nr:outer membrane lipoprotein-sorting protein [candidate division KSB1 bacterium]NIR69062.1 outer membrane lipoprotein-sorting protein [candidate division KSB1 bacterium]NIS25630.1 outer membrane lipoprotein-sorting protein [candidate division KSB1 bacterium]NIT73980.1 outer membrane lipoprotein-sorting protein [candidate division KSB1 bacterium]NIU26307.1 outer membrane lipoprotein-sorting protein [candidate division KSB1 bacterium]